jgi:hypothetical protein
MLIGGSGYIVPGPATGAETVGTGGTAAPAVDQDAPAIRMLIKAGDKARDMRERIREETLAEGAEEAEAEEAEGADRTDAQRTQSRRGAQRLAR